MVAICFSQWAAMVNNEPFIFTRIYNRVMTGTCSNGGILL
jgi:hypothetical protein